MFICGTGNFTHDADAPTVAASKRSKRTASFCRILGKDGNANKNPFADRGLDKFYALLADLDDKKQKIYTRMGSEDISFVRFVYASDESNHVKPIVVKVKEKNRKKANHENRNQEIATATKEETVVPERKPAEEEKKSIKKKRYLRCCKGSCSISISLDRLRQPYWYFVAAVVLIMVLLAVFGRSFAILCTSIGWYLVPTVAGGSSTSASSSSSSPAERKPKRKKESVKKLSEDPSSPTSVINGLPNNWKVQKLQHRHGKKLQKLSTL